MRRLLVLFVGLVWIARTANPQSKTPLDPKDMRLEPCIDQRGNEGFLAFAADLFYQDNLDADTLRKLVLRDDTEFGELHDTWVASDACTPAVRRGHQ
jgi:hypothetical protein